MTNLINRISPASLPDTEALGYSQISVVKSGHLAFVSGQVATDRNSNVPTGLAAQTGAVVRNLKAALQSLGANPHDIVQLRIYSLDMTEEGIGTIMDQLAGFLQGARPSLRELGWLRWLPPSSFLRSRWSSDFKPRAFPAKVRSGFAWENATRGMRITSIRPGSGIFARFSKLTFHYR